MAGGDFNPLAPSSIDVKGKGSKYYRNTAIH
jgi:hypothetical protein